jgi:2-oxoisovalerate dehydrogenase E1 component alpha subunit
MIALGDAMPIDSPTRSNLPPLSLHIPEPQYRPGDTADFSNIEVLAAGVTPRPDSAADASSMRDMVYGLVRVLDDEGKAVGAWNPRLDADTLRALLRAMALTRAFDERMFRAQRQSLSQRPSPCNATTCVSQATASKAS